MKKMNHNEYQIGLKSKSEKELLFIIDDARKSIRANPGNPNNGYYEDEIHYCVMEINERKRLGRIVDSLGMIKKIGE